MDGGAISAELDGDLRHADLALQHGCNNATLRKDVCAVSDPLILRIPGLGGLCHLSVEADGEAIWQMVEKVLSVSARLLSLGAGTGGGQRR